MKRREDHIPPNADGNLKAGLQRLVQLYEATNRSADAARVKDELTEWYRHKLRQLRETGWGSNDLAWLMATCEDPQIRDGASAVNFAEKAVSTNPKRTDLLDTLAAAYAEAGDFAKAVKVQNEAIALLHDEESKKDFVGRLRLYESNMPYREP
jgi:hypothetical protein